MWKTWWLAAVLVLPAMTAVAQRIAASVRGTITDPLGAAMAAISVTARNEDTGDTRSAVTNSSGIYSFPELRVGHYRIEVAAAGFRSEARGGIVLNVADVRVVDVQLQAGQASEVVEVEVPAVAVTTVGAEIAGLVSGEQARELPLNGRNFLQLTLLQPGVTAQQGLNTKDKGLSGGVAISVGGGQTTGNLWLVDGANNNDVGSNTSILVYPSLDAIEEFKIHRNNYGAEFGGAGAAQVNVVTRGGGNEFHGSGYYYARRDRWNAADYFWKRQEQGAAPLHWDDFGATLGGPVVTRKLHIFVSFERNEDARSSIRVSQVPSAAERVGDFDGARPECADPLPVDPLTGRPFPGNVIPEDRLSPGGLLMMQLMSLPNATPSRESCANYIAAVPTPVEWSQWHGRVDYALTDSTRVMLRYTQDRWAAANTNLWGDDPFPVVASDWYQPGRSLVAQLNRNIGASLVNALTFSYSSNAIAVERGGDDPDLVRRLNAAIPTLYPASLKEQRGAAQPAAFGSAIFPYADGALLNQAPWKNSQQLFVLKDDVSAVFGRHFLKAGFLLSYNEKNEQAANTSQESMVAYGAVGFLGPNGFVRGPVTGNHIADWLLAETVWDAGEMRTNKKVRQRWNDIELYAADSHKLTPRLTADYGFRLTHLTAPYEADDAFASFDPAAIDAAAGDSPCNGLLFPPGTNPCPALGVAGGADGPNRSLVPMKLLYVAPRLGLAWDAHGDGTLSLRGGLGLFYQRDNVKPGFALGTNPPFAASTYLYRTLSAAEPAADEPFPFLGTPGAGLEQRAANPRTWQWNLSAQQQLVRNSVLEVAYVGSWGKDLRGAFDANEVAPADRLAFARTGAAALRPLAGVAGLTAFSNVLIGTQDRSSIYHSLQAGLVSRFGQASQASLAYTWAKAIGNAEAEPYTDSRQPWLDRARTRNDRRHAFTASVVIGLPKLEDQAGFVRHVVGDWEITSIVQAATGYPITVFGATPAGLDRYAGLSGTGYAYNQRPNRVVGARCRARGGSRTQWLDPGAFSIDGYAIGTHGTSGRNVCDGPGFFQWDAGLYKNVRLSKKARLQLRAELFNVLDTVNFLANQDTLYAPESVVYDTSDPRTATRILSARPTASFGQLTQTTDARTVQLGIRLTF